MKKLIAVVLALVLALSCMGLGEATEPQPLSYKVSAQLNAMGQELVSLLLNAGIDEDGCYGADVSATQYGMPMFDGFARIAGNLSKFSAGSGEMAFTLTPQVIAEAAKTLASMFLSSAKESGIPVTALVEYVKNGDYQGDLAIAEAVLQNELNRVMQCAFAYGIIAIDEAGNLTIQATADTLVKAAAMYLQALATDDNIIAAVTSMKLWTILQLPDAATCKAMVTALAQQLSAIDASAVNAYLYVYVGADGRIEVTAIYEELSATFSNGNGAYVATLSCGDKFTYYFTYDENGITIVEKMNGMTSTYYVTVSENGITEDVVIIRDADQAVMATAKGAMSASGIVITTEVNEGYFDSVVPGDFYKELFGMKMTENITVDFTTYSFAINVTSDVESVSLTGAPAMTETGFAYNIVETYSDDTETLTETLTIGLNMNEDGSYTAYATLDGVTYYVTFSYGPTETGLEAYIDVNGMYLITAGYGILEDETLMVYVDVNGQSYFVTVAVGYEEDGSITVTATLYSATEAGNMEMGSLIVNVLPSMEPLAHKEGIALTADDIVSLVEGLIYSYSYSDVPADYSYDYAA